MPARASPSRTRTRRERSRWHIAAASLRAAARSVTVPALFARGRPDGGPGKAVRIRRDPVTVIGDETRESHWPRGREGAGSRTIREPGDLPARALFDSGLRGRTRRGFDDSDRKSVV